MDIILSGLLWRFRGIGISGSKALFALLQAYHFKDYPLFASLFVLWITVGEVWGWKPKLIKDSRDWLKSAGMGFMIGGIGAVAVPLSTYLHLKFGEPPFPNNPKAYTFFGKSIQPLNWVGAWNEVYFGVIFSLIVQVIL